MRRIILLTIISAVTLIGMAQTKIYLTAGGKTMTATLADNEAARSLAALLAQGPVTAGMEEYGGFEMVGALPQALPASDTRITATTGDIMLYLGRNIVIFFGQNTWSYTRLGHVDGATAENLREFLGKGSVSLTLSLTPTSGIAEVSADSRGQERVYDLNGRAVTRRPLPAGIYIINGRKTIVGR